MSDSLLMAAMFVGCIGLAAGCKWRIATLAWGAFAVVALAAVVMLAEHKTVLLILSVMLPALAAGLLKFAHWAFVPRHELPRHRVRHLKMRLFCRLHPGRGHATVYELWREWSSRASSKKDRYARP